MFLTNSSENDVIKLRSSLSDIKFLAQNTLDTNKKIPEKLKVVLDDIITIADSGMYQPRPDGIDRAKATFNEQKNGCCGDEK